MLEAILTFLPRAIAQGTPLLYGSTGEIITQKSGNMNLGIPGVIYVGGICGRPCHQLLPLRQME